MRKLILLSCAALVFPVASAHGELYRWVDQQGGIHFSDQPRHAVPGGDTPASDTGLRAVVFPVPGHGALVLHVPVGWRQEFRQADPALPPTIVLAPPQGDDFQVMVTPLWSPENEPGFNDASAARRLVSADLEGMIKTAVEKSVVIGEIRGKYDTGYHFIVTDREPKPGEYPYAMRAGIGVGDLFLSVTVLCRSKESEGIRQTIRALQGAVQN